MGLPEVPRKKLPIFWSFCVKNGQKVVLFDDVLIRPSLNFQKFIGAHASWVTTPACTDVNYGGKMLSDDHVKALSPDGLQSVMAFFPFWYS